MIGRLFSYRSTSLDPYRNLAVEECLLTSEPEDSCALYLWRNRDTVVVGRNQNCWKECLVGELEAAGGHLARRLSGGGAVFHDEGNLNFTFLVRKKEYDLERQLSVVLGAVRSLGLPAEKSGRNDLLVDGRKFSGNAFYSSGDYSYHHGTILISADAGKAARYLSPSREKLAAKGVASVRSRIVNLSELRPDVDVEKVAASLIHSFGLVYGHTVEPLDDGALDAGKLEASRARFASKSWKYNRDMPVFASLSERFGWGEITLNFDVVEGSIRDVQVESDAMDESLILEIPPVLRGSRFSSQSMRAALRSFAERLADEDRAIIADVIECVERQNF